MEQRSFGGEGVRLYLGRLALGHRDTHHLPPHRQPRRNRPPDPQHGAAPRHPHHDPLHRPGRLLPACRVLAARALLGAAAGYLDGDRIISLAKKHGIQALHPGYGFLSENSAFAEKCEREGIVFVGPPAKAMADMGDKARSKEIMTAAGVPCVPGYHGSQQGEAELLAHARDVRFPVLLKSVKGGGGKGMRIVMTEEEFPRQLQSARAEARASFGEGGEVMLVEKYIVRPRHVECAEETPKVLEESPAPDLDDVTRLDLWDKARLAASAVGYVGAGTVEFILDKDTGEFYFMEMNTRLQVEHPVSEMVTGTDLVEWQFRVAAGEKLPLTQDEIVERIKEHGAAIEARIYAENPDKGFMPDSGKLIHLSTPATSEDIRIDAGFVEGDTVSEAYDGMIAKLIVRGKDRETAIRKMEVALRDYEVVGLSTNIEFLKRLCREEAFIQGDVETGFIDKWRESLFKPTKYPDEVFIQAALATLTSSFADEGPHGQVLGFEAAPPTSQRQLAFKLITSNEDQKEEIVRVSVSRVGNRLYNVEVLRDDGQTEPARYDNVVCDAAAAPSKSRLTTFFPNQRVESTVVVSRDAASPMRTRLAVFQHGTKSEMQLLPATWLEKALGTKESAASVVAPMPCKILKNEVEVGQEVKKGTPLVVIESMKMETVIRSPQDGVIKKLAHKEGDICKAGTVLVLFEEAPVAEETA
ncbi:unnamed protein product [Parascedosporium putredinis]|uniref:Uncharacterized protein n=1 Tax=Parascedosporium putredinis TaxID=1442378 RepID=A0A9P1GVV8_9PEZI|nr:unnamed protein product [Parascedosporium putredinis]CAI7988322.1 unnamed protein product [Parascedosporium putredinis]